MQKAFPPDTFKKDFHKPSLEAKLLKAEQRIEDLEKIIQKQNRIIRAFNASNTRQNSI